MRQWETTKRGMLDVEMLQSAVDEGLIDTVIPRTLVYGLDVHL